MWRDLEGSERVQKLIDSVNITFFKELDKDCLNSSVISSMLEGWLPNPQELEEEKIRSIYQLIGKSVNQNVLKNKELIVNKRFLIVTVGSLL